MRPSRVILATRAVKAADPAALVIDHASCSFHRGGAMLFRTGRIRFRLLALLIARASQTVFWDDLIEAMWGDDEAGGVAAPRVYISKVLFQLRHARRPLPIGGRIEADRSRGLVFHFDDAGGAA